MRKVRAFSLVSLAGIGFMLTGCGGGGVSSTPTPPPPPPPPTYSTYNGLTGNQTFNTAAVRAQRTLTGTSVQLPSSTIGSPPVNIGTNNLTLFQPAPFGNTVAIAYNDTSKVYTITAPNSTVLTFGPADLLTATTTPANTNPNVISYAIKTGTIPTSQFSIITPSIGGVDLTYTRIGTGQQITNVSTPSSTSDIIAGVFGVPTLSNDMPVTGSATYSKVQVSGSAVINLLGFAANPGATGGLVASLSTSTGTFTANFASGTIQTALNIIPVLNIPSAVVPTFTPSSVTGTGSIATGTSNFSGTFLGGGFVSGGSFTGQFFGPQAAEFGYSFVLAPVIPGTGAYGTVVGAK